MRLTREIETDAGTVTVRELTVGEVRRWLAGLATAADQPVDVVGEMLFEGFSLADLHLFVDADLLADALPQSQLRAVFAAAKEINPDFFGLRDKLLLAGMNHLAPVSGAPSATSKETL